MSLWGKAQQKSNTERQEVSVSDFIPYACHFDPHTLLTKNGELLQTIKIVGFNTESLYSSQTPLREAVRKAIFRSIPGNEYALWFHTIRRKQNLDPGGEFDPGSFPEYLNHCWQDRHQWKDKYINELYITIVREGQAATIKHPRDFLRGIFPKIDLRYREKYLDSSHEELSNTVEIMLEELQGFGAERLGIIQCEEQNCSELLSFLGEIVNLEENNIPMPVMDLSEYLPHHKISFGFNALEISDDEARHFAAMLTIKEYRELSTKAIDRFLQLPQRFIVTQCIDFINRDKAVEGYTEQRHAMRLGEADALAVASGLEDIVHPKLRNEAIDYGEHQLTIMLIEDDLPALEESVQRAVNALSSLGIVSFREDIKLEDVYWASLPGNFEFISRLKPINTARVGGFASLHNFPAGKATGNHWGPAVTVFHTAAGTPYYFNFHSHDNGHTLIIGPYGTGKTAMLNFLCSEARKFNGPLFFFDKERGSDIFMRAIGGTYYKVLTDSRSNEIELNPLQLPDTKENRNFLTYWLESLCLAQGAKLNREEKALLGHAVDYLYGQDPSQRRLSVLAALLTQREEAVRLVSLMAPWHGEGQYAFLFDCERDTLDLSNRLCGFEMGNIVKMGAPTAPTLLYLLHRVHAELDGSPAMVVLDEAWAMLDNPVFAPQISRWLEELRRRNTVALLATESVEEAAQSQISSVMMDQIATQVYLPNPRPSKDYLEVFRLTEKEYGILPKMRKDKRHFLLKHGGDTIVASLDLAGMDDILAVFSGHPSLLELMENSIAEVGDDPADWIPLFQEGLPAILEKARKEKQQPSSAVA